MRAEALARADTPSWVGPYQLGDVVGRGAMGVVYRATRDGKTYAVKLSDPASEVDPLDAALLFRREAAAIARLDHPALVRVVEFGEHEGQAYLVMDLVEGESLAEALLARRLSEDEVVALARTLADALVELHRYGLVHRDIKPANILLGETGRAWLVDFGLVTDTQDDRVVGTLHYSAPEQLGVINAPVGSPADLYSLGATLFEALGGRPPIGGATVTDFLHHLATVAAPDVRDLRPEVGPALAAILAKLLAKDPDDRYQGGRGLIADLDQLGRFDAQLRGGQAIALGAADHPVLQTALIGRRTELEQLQRCWKLAARGQITFASLEGEAGSGKTRLARELIAQANEQGALVLVAKCHERETVPFGPIREAVDELAARLLRLPTAKRDESAQRIASAAGEWAPLVRRLSPTLDALLPTSGEIRHLEPDAEQQRHYEAIAAFLRGLATERSPLVLVIDDVQWLDEGSRRVLGWLAADGQHGHVLVVSTARTTAASQDGLRRYVETVDPALRDRVVLKPLRADAVEALISARLGGRQLDRATLERLVRLTQGNPFAIGEYLRALLDHAALRPVAGGWTASAADLDALALPQDVLGLVVSRLDGLDAQAMDLIGIAGLIGGRFSVALLGQVAALEPETIARALEAMARAGVVERGYGDVWSFVHDKVREACISAVPPERARDIHQAIAGALDERTPTGPQLYALARHYAAGHVERNLRRLAEVHVQAGLHAVEDHAHEVGYELLEGALHWGERAGMLDEIGPRLYEGLGRAAAMTGRHERAFTLLTEAFARAENDDQRFRLQNLLTWTYASEGRNDEALQALFRTFDVLGRPFPKWIGLQIASLLALWVAALVLRSTGWRRGAAVGEERDRRLVLSRLHYSGSMIALFQGNPLLMVQFVVRDYYNVHFLGATGESAIALAVYGAVLGMFQLRGVMRRCTRLGIEMAEQLGDRAALAVCRAYEAVGTKWAGDLVQGNELLVAALPELHRHVPGSWYNAMMICEQAYSFLHAGHASSAIHHVRANHAALVRTNNKMFRYNTLSVQYAEMLVTGDVVAAAQLWEQLEAEFAPMAHTIYVRLARVVARLEVLGDQRETGPEVDEEVARFAALGGEDYYSHAARMLTGYVRVHQLERARPEHRRAARRRLWMSIAGLSLRAFVPVFACHPLIWRAILARHDGRYRRAARLLDRASVLATRADSRRAMFHIAIERARLAQLRGDGIAKFYAASGLDLATTENWRHKAALVRAEFELQDTRAAATQAASLSRSTEQAARYASALLQVSLATASSLDPDAQARSALAELAKVLGAERALLYLHDADTGELQLRASTGQAGGDASSTVVRQVAETREPLLLTGTDHGGALGSSSIVAHGLRSIIATPLLFRDRFIGVVYLDSRLAKGMFTDEDLALLRGVANHIAISIDTARSARIEAERSVLQRDYELLGAVQNLLLPKVPTFGDARLRGAGVYQPALQCGGDWWWYGRESDGRFLVLLGDVSGHGAAPAMVTSHVAGAFHSLRQFDPDVDPAELLSALGRSVRTFGDGFHMTLSLFRLDPAHGQLTYWNAGGPPLFLARADGEVDVIYAPGRVVGDPTGFDVGVRTVPFGPGDRVLACTDGLLEIRRRDGREVGPRQIVRWLTAARDLPIEEVPARLTAEFGELLREHPQDDDITFIVAEATGAAP